MQVPTPNSTQYNHSISSYTVHMTEKYHSEENTNVLSKNIRPYQEH